MSTQAIASATGSECLHILSKSAASGRTVFAHIIVDGQHYTVSGKLAGGRLRATPTTNYRASEKMYNKVDHANIQESEVPGFWQRASAAVAAARH